MKNTCGNFLLKDIWTKAVLLWLASNYWLTMTRCQEKGLTVSQNNAVGARVAIS